jgi:hypothetical protein
LACDPNPPLDKEEIVAVTVSLTGFFDDVMDSHLFKYFNEPKIHAIYPRYGKKDGGTLVEVWGENFQSIKESTRCNFGTKSAEATIISNNKLTCRSPRSDVVIEPVPFSLSLNTQQTTKDKIEFRYFS